MIGAALAYGTAGYNAGPLLRSNRPAASAARAPAVTANDYLSSTISGFENTKPSETASTGTTIPAAYQGVVMPTNSPTPMPMAMQSVPRPDVGQIIKDASDLLSHQAIMENFVHHNPWEALQHKEFYHALEEVEEKQAYMSPAERLSKITPIDPRVRGHKAVAELAAPFLDRGLAKWEAPNRMMGFLFFFAQLEGLGLVPWRARSRAMAKGIMERFDAEPELDAEALAIEIYEENLRFFEDNPELWEETARSMMLDLPGWSGMVKRMEEHPLEAPASCRDGVCQMIPIRLTEFVAVKSILVRSSMEALAEQEGWKPGLESVSQFLKSYNIATKRRGERMLFGMGKEMQSLQNPSGLANINQNYAQHEQLEDNYAKVTLRAMNLFQQPDVGGVTEERPRPNMQFLTCFDEREESFRRYIEAAAYSPSEIETHGCAGFFNMAMRYKSADRREEEILAPEGNFPPLNHKMVLKEKTPGHLERRKFLAEVQVAYERATFSPVGSLAIAGGLLPLQMGRLIAKSFAPTLTMDLEDKWDKATVPESYTDFESPFTAEEAAAKLAQLFKNIGMKANFGRLVIATGHGARSINNPFIAAYNCGACCGREGGPNARVMARCGNDPEVRRIMAEEHDVYVPDDTWMIGGYHDTTSDLVELYDTDRIPESHKADYARARAVLDEARAKNALERTSKFFLADSQTPAEALKHVERRSRDEAEARPELGHSTNAAIVIGRRSLTKGRFLDRRAFLPAYDPFNDDDEGTNLMTVLTPGLVVGSGISLEYFFSTVDAGAGTKVPVNVVGNFALQQGTAGDLLIGLATQMSELHSPQRLLYLIDAPVARVEKCLDRSDMLKAIVRNDWVKFYVRDPYTQEIFQHKDGEYFKVEEIAGSAIPMADYVPFTKHGEYCEGVKKEEDAYTTVAAGIMAASSALPIYLAGFNPLDLATWGAVDAHQALICTGATALGLTNLAFSRRYLHGEFMYGRMALCSSAMVAGFNIVASAPSLEEALLGWTIIGYSSTFLIGGFNDRPTARDNAAFAFGLYQVSDAALLLAATFAGTNPQLAAFGLIVAASIKSSQFPFSGLFLRSMEGATPNSALGYAALSAHVGVVLLASTQSMWFDYEWARLLLAGTGALTAVQSSAIANVRSDRKGGLASATSATVGCLLVLLAAGYSDTALFLALGHATFRMNQVLRSPSAIQDAIKWDNALGPEAVASEQVFELFWKAGWALNRVNSDWIRLPDSFANVDLKTPLAFYNSKSTQLVVTSIFLAVLCSFHLPAVEERVSELMVVNPLLAAAILTGNILGSTALIRFLLGNVLDFGRFTPTRK